MIFALKLELFYSKDTLLKTYLNRVYLGVNSYGFEDAAQFYFDKSAADLTISEAATLVASLPAPNSYNPVRDYETSVKLRNRVIERMEKLGMISVEEASRARRSPIEISPKARQTFANTIAPHFYDHVFRELQAILGSDVAKEGNFIIETSLDINTQKKAETALKQAVNAQGAASKFSEGAIVTLNSTTGEVLALVGGVDYNKSQFNRAIQAQRQPGSTFKVFAYAAALEAGISPYKAYSCDGLRWQGQSYRPCERSSGSIDMFRGLAQSENSVALRIAQDVGLDQTVAMAHKMGINSELKAVPGLILGQSEVNVLEITGAYGAFANRGVWSRPHLINRILDGNECQDYNNLQTCREIYNMKRDPGLQQQVITPEIANTMTRMMQQVIQSGTGRSAYLGLDEAGKTGTTNRGVDLWFIGYVPSRQRVTGIWLGNDDNSPTNTSSGQAAQLWGSYMKDILINK
jgi:membrane peptidoglycan carboxypeptidase